MAPVAYATCADLLKAWPRVLSSGLDEDELVTMLARASNRIDTELCRRYALPFSPVPPMILDLTVDLAMLDVLYRSQQSPEFVVQRITWAQEQLGRIRDGDVCLVESDGTVVDELTESEASGTLGSNTSGYTPTFGVGPSLAEVVDPDRIDDETDAR